MRTRTLLTLAVAASLAGCGGGSTTPASTNNTSGSTTPAQYSEQSIGAANALGSSVKNIASFEKSVAPQSKFSSAASHTAGAGSFSCSNGFEFLVPDSNGDANSTEAKYFYDSACTQIARDVLRIFTPATQGAAPATETVALTEMQYAQGNSTAIASRTESVELTAPSSADFDAEGYASTATGYERTASDMLLLQGGTKTIESSTELVMQPATAAGQNAYCSDAADFNATGISALNETFGGAGGVGDGSRVVNGDGSVTWSATHAGTAYKGSIGGLSIATGSAPNTACPITTPLYSLAGGTAIGSYSIPMTTTFVHGMLTAISVTNAQLANGNTLSISSSGSPLKVAGTIGNASGQIATFSVDAFGDGTLTVTKTGKQYVMQDWHVVR